MPGRCQEVWTHPPSYSVLVQAAEVGLAPYHRWGNRGSGMESYLPTQLGSYQAGIKIAGRNTNNLRYADGTTLMAETEEELKSLLMKVKNLA